MSMSLFSQTMRSAVKKMISDTYQAGLRNLIFNLLFFSRTEKLSGWCQRNQVLNLVRMTMSLNVE